MRLVNLESKLKKTQKTVRMRMVTRKKTSLLWWIPLETAEGQEAKEHGDGPIRSLWTQLVLNGAPPQNTNAYFTMVGSDIEAMITSGVDDSTTLRTLTRLPFLANFARMAMDSMQPLHGRPSAASVEAGMASEEDTEPVETAGDGDSDNALLEAADAHETVDEIVAVDGDEIE